MQPQTETLAPPSTTDAAGAFARLLQVVWNERRVEALDGILAHDFVMHTTAGGRLDAEGYASAVRAWHAGFPDLHVETIALLAQGDLVAARILLMGTMEGPFGGRAPTGQPMRVEGRPWVRVENGRIAEFWSLADDAAMWAQLGLPPHTL